MCTNTGNPGSYLADTGSVYITRDGGLIWNQVRAIHNFIICHVQKGSFTNQAFLLMYIHGKQGLIEMGQHCDTYVHQNT